MVQYFFLYSFNLVKFSNHMSIFLQVFAFNYSFCIKNINIFHFLYFPVILLILPMNKSKKYHKKPLPYDNGFVIFMPLFYFSLIHIMEIIGKFCERIN